MHRQAFRHCAEWIIAPTDQITVERFFGWRRGAKRRMFQPCAVLKAGEHQIIVDGLAEVFALIDAIQPGLPRNALKEGMKGGFMLEGEPSFAHDLQAFLRESAFDFLIFSCDSVRMREPNSDAMFVGLKMRTVVAHTAMKSPPATPAHLGATWAIRAPYRGKNGEVLAPALVFGDYPHIVVAMNLNDTPSFSFKEPTLISSVVCAVGGGLDLRPHATVKRDDPHRIIDEIERRIADMHESGFVPEPFLGDDRTGGGMTFKERDMIERQRAIQAFCDLDTPILSTGLKEL